MMPIKDAKKSDEIKILSYQKKYAKEASKIVEANWSIQPFGHDRNTSIAYADNDFQNCLADSSRAYLLTVNGEVAAYLLGRIEMDITPFKTLLSKVKKLRLFMKGMGKLYYKIFKSSANSYSTINAILYEQSSISYDAEAIFFAVHPDFQGHGYGKQLMQHFVDQVKEAGCTKLVLYTDTTCNYGFYDAFGFERTQSIMGTLPHRNHQKVEFYQYAMDLH